MNTEELRIYLRTVADTAGAKQTQQALGTTTSSALRLGAAFVGITSATDLAMRGLDAMRQTVATASEAFIRSERLSRGTSAAYGAMASSWLRFADQMSSSTGQSRDAFLEAALSARTLAQNYGLTTDQTRQLIKASADLATIRGIGVAEAFERVQSAIRGEAEASEYLGLTLNDTFLKNQAMNGSLRNTFETMTDAQKAQVRFIEVLRQSAQFSGIATQGANSLEGAQKKATVSSENFSRALGKVLAPALREVATAQTLATDSLTAWLAQWEKVPTEQELRTRAVAIEKALPLIGPPEVPRVPLGPEVGARQGESGAQALRRGLEEAGVIQRVAAAKAQQEAERADRRAHEARLRRLRELNENLPTRDTAAELARVAFLDQVSSAVRDAVAAQERQVELEREAVDLAAQEARLRLSMLPAQQAMAELQRRMTEQQIRARQAALPATEALEDLRFSQQRAQLISQNRNIDAQLRIAARQELRGIGRALPGAELAALEAGRGVTLAGRAAERLGMEQQLFEISTQRQLQQITEAQTANGYLSAIATQKTQAIELTINMSGEGFQQEVFKQLVEANNQAQGPTVVKLSGVRR